MTQLRSIESIETTPAPTEAFNSPPRAIPVAPVRAELALESMLTVAVPITYIAGVFPARSETFVYREVRELRRRGWDVTAISLNEAPDEALSEMANLARGRMTVYGHEFGQTLTAAVKELFNHPLLTIKTLWLLGQDVIAPAEPTPASARLKLIGQGMAAIGLAGRLRLAGGTRHVHCHFAHAPTTIGMYAAKQLGVPFSFTGHANDIFQRRVQLRRKLERAAFVACISRWHREFYRAIAPADDTVYPVVRCGVDLKTWDGSTAEAKIGANRATGTLNVLTVCRLVEKKGVDVLVRAMARFGQSSGRFWRLTIAGDGPERDKIRQVAAELGVSDRVEFLGAVSNERVRELLGSANIFALACRPDSAGDRDGIPVVLMEAMAAGVPVISGDLPAIRELVVPGIAGLLVPPGDAAALAEAMDRLARTPALRAELTAGAHQVMAQEFDLEMNVTRLERLLESNARGRKTNGIAVMQTPGANGATTTAGGASRRYALITPCRDEARYARRTLDSVTRQSVPPAVWVIVDDGSKDETPQILAEYATRFPYIQIVTRADRGDRKLGGGVIDAFYTGYETLNPDDFDYVCKLDLDLDLPAGYFQTLMERMEQNPRIGTSSGKPFFMQDGQPVSEMCGDENSVGMVKFYRTECFKQIGGFVRELMWDGIDCHRCRMKGWIAVSWDEPGINFEHLRPMGTSHKNWWTGRVRHGVGQYYMGTGPVYMLASALFRMTRPPIVVGGLAMLWGYVRSAWQGKPRYSEPDFRRFLRRYQWDALLKGKTVATERLNRRQSTSWKLTAQKVD